MYSGFTLHSNCLYRHYYTFKGILGIEPSVQYLMFNSPADKTTPSPYYNLVPLEYHKHCHRKINKTNQPNVTTKNLRCTYAKEPHARMQKNLRYTYAKEKQGKHEKPRQYDTSKNY